MPLRILHAATHHHNIGDGALVAGLQATLREDLGCEIDFDTIDVLSAKLERRRHMLDVDDAALARDYDLVLVGGGGMIEGGPGNYLSGINFGFDLELLERPSLPWVFYALGVNQFRRSVFFHRAKLNRLVELCGRSDRILFSVRNDGSLGRLEGLIGSHAHVRSIPDPGLWLPVSTAPRAELADDRPNVLIQLAGDRLRRRLGWRTGRFVADLARVLAEVVARRQVHLVFGPHLLTDYPLYAALAERLPRQVLRGSCSAGPVLAGSGRAPEFFSLHAQSDLVVGMRGHAAICSIGVGTPVIGVATHAKIVGFFEEVGLDDWVLDVDEDPRLRGLGARIDSILDDLPASRARIGPLRDSLREETRTFHRDIRRLLR